MHTKYSLVRLLAASVIPFRLHAVDPAEEPTPVEKLNASLKNKEQLIADISAANQRTATAKAALATVKSEAASAAATAAASLAEANGKIAEAEERTMIAQRKAYELLDPIDTRRALLASVGFDVQKLDLKDKDGNAIAFPSTEHTNAFQKAWNTHIANEVTARLAKVGVSVERLPAFMSAEQAESILNNFNGYDRVRAAFALQSQKD